MDSLSPECTPLKKRYDACFNLWFEGYLRPALDGQARLAPSSSSPSSSTSTPSGSSSSGSSSSSSSTPSSSTGEPTSSSCTAAEPSRRLVTSWGRAFDRKTPKEVSVLPPGQAFLSFNDPDNNSESFAAGESDLAGGGYTAGGTGGHAPHAGVQRVDPTGKTRAQVKAEEYELACGAAWKSYQKCLKIAIAQNPSLSELLDSARQEHPLHSLVGLEGTVWDADTPVKSD